MHSGKKPEPCFGLLRRGFLVSAQSHFYLLVFMDYLTFLDPLDPHMKHGLPLDVHKLKLSNKPCGFL